MGAVVLGWNKDWSKSYHTITKKDGTFELLGDVHFCHWKISATEYSMVYGELEKETPQKTKRDNIPTFNIGIIEINKLTFID